MRMAQGAARTRIHGGVTVMDLFSLITTLLGGHIEDAWTPPIIQLCTLATILHETEEVVAFYGSEYPSLWRTCAL